MTTQDFYLKHPVSLAIRLKIKGFLSFFSWQKKFFFLNAIMIKTFFFLESLSTIIKFQYLPKLEIVIIACESKGDFASSNVFRNLFSTNDSGLISPNPLNIFLLNGYINLFFFKKKNLLLSSSFVLFTNF